MRDGYLGCDVQRVEDNAPYQSCVGRAACLYAAEVWRAAA